MPNVLQPGEADKWYDRDCGVHEVGDLQFTVFWRTDPEDGWYWKNRDADKVTGPFWSSGSAYEDAINQPKQEKPEECGMIRKTMVIRGVKTSVSLEREFWDYLIAQAELDERIPVSELVNRIAAKTSPSSNLTSAIRVHCLRHARGS